MAPQVLKNARVYLGGLDVSGQSNELALPYESEVKESTTFASGGAREKVCGLLNWSLDLKGFVEYGEGLIDERLFQNVAVPDQPASAFVDSTAGARGYFGKSLQASYAPGAKVGDLMAFAVKIEGSGGLVRGTLLEVGAKATSGNGTAQNLGAVLASQYLYGILHVVAWTGLTSITVKIQSDDAEAFTTPTDRVTFAAATGIGAQFAVPVLGPIADTWWRANWAVVGTGSALIVVGIGIQ